MLTKDQLYIIPEIEEQIKKDKENYYETIKSIDISESIPHLHFAYHSLDAYPNLKQILLIQESLEEFSVNAYYFILYQLDIYRDEVTPTNICEELARKDLLNIYQTYNQIEIIMS